MYVFTKLRIFITVADIPVPQQWTYHRVYPE
jgi:hypothetical protein